MTKQIVWVALSMLFFSSCATLFSGTKDNISFTTTPSGASIYKDGLKICTTPCTTKIKRSLSDVNIEIKLDGYSTRVITLDKEFNTTSIINLTNLIGWGIDAATGAMMKYDRKAYDIELEKDKKVSSIPVREVHINTKTNTVDVYVQN